jgi:hypothetical protein
MTYSFTKTSPGVYPGSLVVLPEITHDARQQGGCMQVMNLKFAKFSLYMVLVVGLSASAFASCGDSLAALAAGAASFHSQTRSTQAGAQTQGDQRASAPIVGLWHIQFVVGDQTIQEAYQVWNVGGTEVHNPNVDPRTGNVCLGVWKHTGHRTYTLAHRVWNYDANGNFLGTIHLSETVTVDKSGATHGGSFALDFYDPTGNFQFEVPGSVVAERVSVD